MFPLQEAPRETIFPEAYHLNFGGVRQKLPVMHRIPFMTQAAGGILFYWSSPPLLSHHPLPHLQKKKKTKQKNQTEFRNTQWRNDG